MTMHFHPTMLMVNFLSTGTHKHAYPVLRYSILRKSTLTLTPLSLCGYATEALVVDQAQLEESEPYLMNGGKLTLPKEWGEADCRL